MKISKENIPKMSVMLFISFAFLSLSMISCGSSGGTDANPPDDNNPPSMSFDSNTIGDGANYNVTFDQEGTIEYFCQIHAPNMQGQVIVSSNSNNSGEVTVVIENLQFNPSSITIAPGTTVTWVNQDGTAHDLKSGNPDDNGGGGPRY